MAKVIPLLKYRERCINQGRDGIKPLTRKQEKALRQHTAAGKDYSAPGYKAKTTTVVEPRFNILGEIVAFVRQGE